MSNLIPESVLIKNSGYCPICEKETVFIETGPWLRDEYLCSNCKSIPRWRALIRTLNRFVPNWKDLNIHESSANGIFIDYFSERCSGYSHSRYFTDILPGEYKNGVRCENLESLTFPGNSIDIFITQDVIEHVFDPYKAFSEIERVLKSGGFHIFTVPIYDDIDKTIQKARLSALGEIEYLDEPEYHINDLVTYHYGFDIIEFIGSDILTTIILEKDRDYGIDGEFLHVFACKKLLKGRIS